MLKLWLAWILILIFVLGIVIITGEIYFRFSGTMTWFENYRIDKKKHSEPMSKVTLNSRGLRDEEYDHPKGPDIFRLLILGDSFTYGYGVNNREDLFAEILERRLNKEAVIDPENKIEVLNAGGENKITGDWLKTFREELVNFKPDMVVAIFTYRDAAPPRIAHITFRNLESEFGKRNQNLWFYKHSSFFRFIKNSVDGYNISKRIENVCNSMFIGSKKDTAEWEIAKKNLVTIRDLAQENGMPFYLVIFPALIRLDDTHPFFPIINVITEFTDKNGIECFSLFETFRGQKGPNLWVSKYDQHPNEEGHAITADALFGFVSEKMKDVQSGRREVKPISLEVPIDIPTSNR